MRLIRKDIERDSSGFVILYPEEPEDIWHLYNLIHENDLIRASTIRRIQNESSIGSVTSERVRLTLTLRAKKIDFDPEVFQLHINGIISEENKHIRIGSYHTLDLGLHSNFTLKKQEWDSVMLERLNESCDPSKRAEIGAIILQEGLANVCLITEYMTILKQKIEVHIPRKRKENTSDYQKGINKFYEIVMQAMLRSFDFNSLKVILIASPGFLNEALIKYIFHEATKVDNKLLLQSRPKFLRLHSSSGHMHSLNEILKSPSISAKLADMRFVQEIAVLDKFYKILHNDETKVWYGIKEVSRAVECKAVETLLISDKLFRSYDVNERRHYVKLVETVKQYGGKVSIFSSLHESGIQLNQLTGIAAILAFPINIDKDDE